ncbi:MAG: NIPSNAP family protein, partial [Promethearchaeota archaeon]
IVGYWVNAEDENEVYYISKYKDESDYKKKVESLHHDEEYMRLSDQLKKVRASIESTKLLPMMSEA